MKNFFKNMNFARALILVSLLGTIAVGAIAWKKSQELDVLRVNLETDMPKVAQSLLVLSQRHTSLSRSLKGDDLAAQANIETYILKVALKDEVDMGEPDVSSSEQPTNKGIVDKKYRITPSDKQQVYERLRLINFLFSLEDGSRRVKVTRVKLENAVKRLKPHEIPDDKWTFEAEITSRQRAEG